MLHKQNEYGILSYQMEHLEEFKHTKRKLFEYLRTEKKDLLSGQCMATILVIKKTRHSMKIINEWYRIASFELHHRKC